MNMVIGIDEVGRGPVAGPVTVCAFVFLDEKLAKKKNLHNSKDSKKLTEKKRNEWFVQIRQWQKEGKCDFVVTSVSAQMIDKIGIVPSIQKALNMSLKKLVPRSCQLEPHILLDGGLKAPKEYAHQKTIIKGDEKESVIAMASIVAKVTRDGYMRKMATKYPEYGFEKHVGYGTKAHYEAIKKYGMTPLHRRTFLRI
ncbi:MAG: ribonuclease HII [bacterium]